MSRLVVCLFLAALVSCGNLRRSEPPPRPSVISRIERLGAHRVLARRVMLEHPVNGWRRDREAAAAANVSAVLAHRDGRSRIVVSVHDRSEVKPIPTCRTLQELMMLNGAPVSPLRKASDGSWCRYNFRGEVEGVACVGVILVKRWSDQVVVLIGRWPPEADEKRLKDFETISGSLALLPER